MSRHDRSRSLRSLRWLLVPRLTGPRFGCAEDVFVRGDWVCSQSILRHIYIYIYIHIYIYPYIHIYIHGLPSFLLANFFHIIWCSLMFAEVSFQSIFLHFWKSLLNLVIHHYSCCLSCWSLTFWTVWRNWVQVLIHQSQRNYWGFAIWDYTASTEKCGVMGIDGRNIPPATCSPDRSPSMDLKFTDVPCTIEAILRKRRIKFWN